MSKQIMKKTGICCLSASFVAGMMLSGQWISIMAEESDAVKADIYPKPQQETYQSKEGMNVPDTVNVVLHGKQEEAMVSKLEEMLYENGIKYEMSDQKRDDMSNLVISSDVDHCNECGNVSGDALEHKEGYVLVSSDDDNTKGDITIVGTDSDGAYNGMLTLGQVVKQKTADNKMAEVEVSDYPEIGMRGYIEGFYGYPWTHEERMSLMKDTSKYKMNTYIYAPKDDPYHRANWKDLYPEDKAQELAELAQAGHENNFNFCWTIHPGASLKFNEEDYQALIVKYEQLYDLGVRQFGVLFDDTDDWSNGTKQAEFINRIDTEFVKAKGDVQPMIVIAARYNQSWGPSVSYFKPYMQLLHDDIQIMWTGAATMSNISKSVFDYPRKWTGVDRDVAVWWNYPVNDYCDSRLLMAPLHNLNPDLDNVTGFFANPMQQADASKVALYSIADYTWNTNEFDYMESWERSIEELVPEESEAYKNFAEDTNYLKDDGGASGPFVYNESWNSTKLIDALKKDIADSASIKGSSSALKVKYAQIIKDADALLNMKNENLLEETLPFIQSYRALGVAGVHAMNALVAAEDGNLEQWLNENNASRESLAEMSTYTITSLEGSGTNVNIVAVGEQYLRPAVETALNAASTTISKEIITVKDTELFTKEGNIPADITIDNGQYNVRNASAALGNEESITLALPKAIQITKVEVDVASTDGLQLETSLNGIDWVKANTTQTDTGWVVNEQIAATFIRIVNISGQNIDVTMNALRVTPVYKANPSVSENIGTYQTNPIKNALDGNFSTKFWSDKAPSAGHYIQVDLGKIMPLYDVTGYFGSGDYLQYGNFEVSENGITWESLGKLTYTAKSVQGTNMQVNEVNANGKMVRYFRYKATGTQNNWLQAYEIEINKLAMSGDDVVSLFDSNMTGSLMKMADGDLTTGFSPEEVHDGDYAIYTLTRSTNFKNLMVLQSLDRICNADVSVKLLDGTWKKIGALDKQLSEFAIDQVITQVRFDFKGDQPIPEIFEIITSDKQAVDNTFVKGILNGAIIKAQKAVSDGKVAILAPAVKEAFETYLQTAEDIYANPNASVEDVMNAWKDLAGILHYLDFTADKGMLNDLITYCEENINIEDYDSGIEAYTAALAKAKAIIADDTALQTRINLAYDELTLAVNGLGAKEVNKAMLAQLLQWADTAIEEKDKYTQDQNWTDFMSAVTLAKSVYNDDDATQSQINDVFGKLASAYENIRLKPDEAMLAKLNDFVDLANAMNAAQYSVDDYAYVVKVKETAMTMLADPSFTANQYAQVSEQIDQALRIMNENMLDTPVVDEPTDPELPAQPEGDKTPVAPEKEAIARPQGTAKTGDSTNVFMYSIMLGGAVVATISAKKRMRK